MSYRYRPSGYRSQPVSNRTSLYLPSDYNTSNFSDDLSDFDRQFKKLLERTEKFTNRVERLQSTATYIKKGFRRIDSTVTGIRSQRDVIETAFDSIENRLHEDVGDPPTTEDEWRKFLDAAVLIEKAVELMRSRYRHPKPVFEYSPEERSPYSFDISSSTSLVSNPHSPSDGNKIQNVGYEAKQLNKQGNPTDILLNHASKKSREKMEKFLPILSEETDEHQNGNCSNATSKQTDRSGLSSFRSSRIFDDSNEKPRSKFTMRDDEEKGNNGETMTRRTSFLRTLISTKKKNRPTSMIEKSQDRQIEADERKYGTLPKLPSNRRDEQVNKQVQKAKSMNLDDVAKSVAASFQSSGKSSLNTSLSLFHEDNESSISTSLKKRSSSSSFHEYNPSNRIPLKERLRMKQAAENAAKDKEPEISPIVPNTPLALRASKLVKTKERDEKDGGKKDENNSLKSRFLRRFRSSKSDHTDVNHSAEEASRRRRTRPISDEVTENDLSNMIRERRKSETEEYRCRSVILNELRSSRHSSETKSSRLNSSSKNTDTNSISKRNHRKSRPLSGDEEVFNPPARSFSDITYSLRENRNRNDKPKIEIGEDARNHVGMEDEEDEDIGSVVRRRRRKSRQRNDSEEHQHVVDKTTHSIGGNPTNSTTAESESNTATKLLPEVEETSQVVMRCHKTSTDAKTELMNLNRKSVLILEDEIIPVHTREELRDLVFRSPKRSLDEVSEEEVQFNMANDQNLPEDIFDTLKMKQKQIFEEEISLVQTNDAVDDVDLQRLNQLSPLKETVKFFSEDIIEPTKKLDEPVQNAPESFSIAQKQVEITAPDDVKKNDIAHNGVEEAETISEVKKSSIENMLIEFDKIHNEIMSEEHNLGNENIETITEFKVVSNENELNSKDQDGLAKVTKDQDGLAKVTDPSDYSYNHLKVSQQSSILENTDIAVVTLAKYSGKLVSDISGQLPIDVYPIKNELKTDSESLHTKVPATIEIPKTNTGSDERKSLTSDDLSPMSNNTQKGLELKVTSEPLTTAAAIEIAKANPDNDGRKSSTSDVSDVFDCTTSRTERSSSLQKEIEASATQNKSNFVTAQLVNGHFTSTPKKRLSYREKREAHMKLLNNSLSASLTSLTEADIVATDEVNVDPSGPPAKSDTRGSLENGVDVKTIDNEESIKLQFKKELRENIYLKATELNLDKSARSLYAPITVNKNIVDCVENNNDKSKNFENTPTFTEDKLIISDNEVHEAITNKEQVETLEKDSEINDNPDNPENNNGNSKNEEKFVIMEAKSNIGVIKSETQSETVVITSNTIVEENEDEYKTELTVTEQATMEIRLPTPLSNIDNVVPIDVTSLDDRNIMDISISTKSGQEDGNADEDTNCVTSQVNGQTDPEPSSVQPDSVIKEECENEPTFVRPVLEKQMSIKEYRRRKLERQGTSETSCSDDSIVEKSDIDKSMLSSLADVSDVSEENRCRNKRYSHSRKDLRHVGLTSESSSESENSNVVLPVADKNSHFIKTFDHVDMNNKFKIRRNSSDDVGSQSDRRRRYMHRFPHKSVE